MKVLSYRRLFLVVPLFVSLALLTTQCTSSSDGDTSVLEEELKNMDSGDLGSTMTDDIDDLDEIAEEDLQDVVSSDDSLSEYGEEEWSEEGGDQELASDQEVAVSDDPEFSDDEFSDDEFSDEEFSDNEQAVADNSGDEFEEFSEFDESANGDEFAQDEQSLAEEVNKQQDYPVAENAQPQFPEEVVGSEQESVGSAAAGPIVATPLITSESQELGDLPDPIEPTVPQDDIGIADPIVPTDDKGPSEQSWIPVVKVKTDPFYRNNRLMNAVYIARPDENLEIISEKIYGQDRSKELSEDNPHLAKGIDPGDKVYYNSPNRADDRSELKIYYADIGLPPQYYTTKNNDNMRRLGTKLIGFADGWKELWAINPNVDSKTILPAGLRLKYWTGNESKPTLLADAQEIPGSSNDSAEDLTASGTTQEAAPFEETELPPEPPLPEAQIAGPDPTLAPEPVPDIEPMPVPGIEQTPGASQVIAQPDDGDSLLTVGAVALLVIAGAGLVAIQIKKRKDNTAINPASLEYTQV